MPKPRRKSGGRRSLNDIDAGAYDREEDILGFSPVTLIDDVINAVHDYACDIVDDLEEELAEAYPEDADTLHEAFDKVLDIWTPSLDRYLDKFELFALQNSFKVPKSITALNTALLPGGSQFTGDSGDSEGRPLPPEQQERQTKLLQEEAKVDARLREMRRRLHQAQCELHLLKQKDEALAISEPELMKRFCKPNGSGEMDEEFEGLLSEAAELREILEELPEPRVKPSVEQAFHLHQTATGSSSSQDAAAFAQRLKRK